MFHAAIFNRFKGGKNTTKQFYANLDACANFCDRCPGISPIHLYCAVSGQSVLFTTDSRTNLLPSPSNKTRKQLLSGPDGDDDEEEEARRQSRHEPSCCQRDLLMLQEPE